MRAVNLISHAVPFLRVQDTVRQALQLMTDFHITHLPVVQDDKYLGLVEENALLDIADEDTPLGETGLAWNRAAIGEEEHFLAVLRLWKKTRLSVIPVINRDIELQGVITATELLLALDEYTAAEEPGGLIVLSIEPRNFSLSEIGRLAESNDATIVHVATQKDPTTGMLSVSIKLNRNDIQDILATFQRYEYTIETYFGDNLSEDDLRSNYAHLMNYLNI
ncbi:CBS domain-containing protein [Dinghuibacter silviterrae]|uniref:CBS domain-containing protein n=1 Tax=Dinghuibacter silviterrae TaxID=1539049 RepID=A0A4V3GLK3_9BACT|nr:CBS domain-containing protein [Dinghuibacter silviterrae]TDW99882.1 CBS domain-containing protein [Dinghuibacter silviterrae]